MSIQSFEFRRTTFSVNLDFAVYKKSSIDSSVCTVDYRLYNLNTLYYVRSYKSQVACAHYYIQGGRVSLNSRFPWNVLEKWNCVLKFKISLNCPRIWWILSFLLQFWMLFSSGCLAVCFCHFGFCKPPLWNH